MCKERLTATVPSPSVAKCEQLHVGSTRCNFCRHCESERLATRRNRDSLGVSVRSGNSYCPESVSTVRKVPGLAQVTARYQPCGFARPIPGVSCDDMQPRVARSLIVTQTRCMDDDKAPTPLELARTALCLREQEVRDWRWVAARDELPCFGH
jgi:hypothetical protein